MSRRGRPRRAKVNNPEGTASRTGLINKNTERETAQSPPPVEESFEATPPSDKAESSGGGDKQALPGNHWLFDRDEDGEIGPPPMGHKLGTENPAYHRWVGRVEEAGRWAFKATVKSSTDPVDPDALIANLVIGLLGFPTPTGDAEK